MGWCGQGMEEENPSLIFQVLGVGGEGPVSGQRGLLLSSPGVTGLCSASLLLGAQVPGVGRLRLGSASTTTPTGS